MKKSALSRSTKPMKRTRIKQRNAKRARERFRRAYDSVAFVEWTRQQPSCVSGEIGCVCSHSALSRAAGGRAWHVCPLTPAEHDAEHRIGRDTFWRRMGKNPVVQARRHWQRWLAYCEVREW